MLDGLSALTGTAQRIAGFYDGILPDLDARYRRYLEQTDALLDEPTVRIIERILLDYARMRTERDAVRRDRADMTLDDPATARQIRDRAVQAGEAVAFRPAPKAVEAI